MTTDTTRVGDASYSLYLLDPFVTTVMFVFWKAARLQEHGGAYMIVTVGVIIVSSLLTCRYLERPLTSGAKALFSSPFPFPFPLPERNR